MESSPIADHEADVREIEFLLYGSDATTNAITLRSGRELPEREGSVKVTEDSEVEDGKDLSLKEDQETRLEADSSNQLDHPGRASLPPAEKSVISEEKKQPFVPPPYKPKLPFPGRIKKESMERYKEISVKQLMEIEVHMPLIDEFKLIPPHLKFLKEAVIEKNAQVKDELLLEAEECIKEFEFLLGCTVDENCVIRYEEQVKPVAIMISSTKSNGEVVGVVGTTYEDPCEGVMVVECIVDKHLGITFTYEVSIYEPRKIPFEEIRMKEFRGWFYDEYDPGDTWTHLIRSKLKSSLETLNKLTWEEVPCLSLYIFLCFSF